MNKSDLGTVDLSKIETSILPIVISKKENRNVDKLIDAIKLKLKNNFKTSEDNVLITRSRHRYNLKECVKHLNIF